MLPDSRTPTSAWLRGLARRGAPFAAIAVIFAVQALAGAEPVLAFPLYLAVVLLTSLQLNRTESIATASLAAVAILIPPLFRGAAPGDMAPAVLLSAVMVIVAVALSELRRQARAAAARAEYDVAEISASRQTLASMLEAASVGLGILGTEDGRWSIVNQGLASILGRDRDALAVLSLKDVVAPADGAAIEEALAMLRSGDLERWEGDVTAIRQDGTPAAVAISVTRMPARGGAAPASLLVQVADVGEVRRVERLRACLTAVRQLMASAVPWESSMPQILSSVATSLGWDAALLWAMDADGKALRVRHMWRAEGAELGGYVERTRSIQISRGHGVVVRAWNSGVVAAEPDVAGLGEEARLDLAYTTGVRAALAFPVVEAGAVTGVVELVAGRSHDLRDDEVTLLSTVGVELGQFIRRSEVAQALRRSEADHRAIFERSPIGIARISGEGELVEANPALLAMLEHDIEAMRETSWPDILHAYDQAASRRRTAPLLAGMTDGATVQIRAATGGGKWLWLQLTATSIPDANGRPEHVLLMIEDVTAVRETSDRLQEALESQRAANANLERLDRTKTEFLSIVSHEFRTALTGIQGFSELIRDGGLEPEEVRAYGGYVFNDADRVNRLIGDMLDLDRMESGRMTMRSADVDINDVLTETMTRAAGPSPAIDFKVDLDPRLPIVSGDRDRLVQVASNLVNNAVKYSPDGGTVTVSSRIEGNYALVSVTDTGLGIPPDEIGHVFERFRRVRSGVASSIPGTGLGLTIVKQIVEMHGGKIWVESAVGHGSAFHFTIPLTASSTAPVQLRHA